MSEVVYECIRCGELMTEKQLDERGGAVKCVDCGYKVLMKTRSPIVRRIKTR